MNKSVSQPTLAYGVVSTAPPPSDSTSMRRAGGGVSMEF